MDPSNGHSRVETFNQLVRSLVTIGLTMGFLYGFVVLKTIGGDIYVTVFAGVIGYWFAQRDAARRSSDAVSALADRNGDTNGTPKPATGG